MYNYSIMPLNMAHIDEVCNDIAKQYKDGVADLALFKMTLTPEGNPVIDKAAMLCEQYVVFRDKLREMGIDCGILVQSSIGHGYVLNELSPFVKYTNLTDGEKESTVCPLDPAVHEYFYNAMKTIAKCEPKLIMVDDDFRLMGRFGKGCACELHMAEFERLAGVKMSREELYNHTLGDSELDERYTELFVKTQGDSLIALAKSMRKGIDEIDPKIPGAICSGGDDSEFAEDVAAILAGEGNPKIARFNNGAYHPENGAHHLSYHFGRAAKQAALMRGKVDVLLAETDTCPQNRYSTGAQFLHSHFTGTILEGASGAKHWITRLFSDEYDEQTGKAYRKILGKNKGFYEELSKLVPKLRPVGCKIPLSTKRKYYFKKENVYGIPNHFAWSTYVLERLGLPTYFSANEGGAAFMTGDLEDFFTNDELKEILSGVVFLASDSLEKINARGFEHLTGVKVKEWCGEHISGEIIPYLDRDCATQKTAKELIPLYKNVEINSYNYHIKGGKEKQQLFPATTVFKNELGGTVVCFCGIPKTWYHYSEAFSFLCETRKLQFIELLKSTGNLPVYFKTDEEMYMRAGFMNDSIFCALFNLSYDTAEEIELYVDRKISSVQILTPDGKWQTLDFTTNGEFITINAECRPLNPVALLLK